MSFWQSEINETITNSFRFIAKSEHDNFSKWLSKYNEKAPTSSNQGTIDLPFQRWFRFKEAFSPKFVVDTLTSLPYEVNTCLDPFLGSGTTAITCKLMGINSIGTEVNPFLADLISAKLKYVSPEIFLRGYKNIIDNLEIIPEDFLLTPGMPLSFTEPGIKGRFIFYKNTYATIRALLRTSKLMSNDEARLFKVLLGSVLIENSNAIVNGKGRRYRRNWESRVKTGHDVIRSLNKAVYNALEDIQLFRTENNSTHTILNGDTRKLLKDIKKADVIIFSPPYPNSFDYTDVYNIELWMLDYLKNDIDNKKLRNQTFRSHVQAKWNFDADMELNSKTLITVFDNLNKLRKDLWNKNIPEMVYNYFEDLQTIFKEFSRILPVNHHAIVAIGDSQYAGVHIDVGVILEEILISLGFVLQEKGEIRSMRSSSQHGGKFELSEHCLVFKKIR
ncbi:DNA methyltransferase [Klebsiella pneumoniae]|uniref:DNA methyltransferase n=1 Tax=Klebsiella pneumoniae TaxID=573 RepID=UPI0027BA54CC|nr:DNA methyltransferase [Klebsiella pneumoniae]WLX73676.1 DNA methyltransferase [Klebsiella pneumoniae]